MVSVEGCLPHLVVSKTETTREAIMKFAGIWEGLLEEEFSNFCEERASSKFGSFGDSQMKPCLLDTDILSLFFRNDTQVVYNCNLYLQKYG